MCVCVCVCVCVFVCVWEGGRVGDGFFSFFELGLKSRTGRCIYNYSCTRVDDKLGYSLFRTF